MPTQMIRVRIDNGICPVCGTTFVIGHFHVAEVLDMEQEKMMIILKVEEEVKRS